MLGGSRKTHKMDSTRIFNMNKSGFTIVQTKWSKIIAKRKKRVGTTLVCCTSASGLLVRESWVKRNIGT